MRVEVRVLVLVEAEAGKTWSRLSSGRNSEAGVGGEVYARTVPVML